MKQIGAAYNMYTGDNSDKLPYGGIIYADAASPMKIPAGGTANGGQMSWDDLIDTYLGGVQTAGEMNGHGRLNWGKFPKMLRCPSDTVPLQTSWVGLGANAANPGIRKSYAPPRYELGSPANALATAMGTPHLPIGPNAMTGTGLQWSWASWQTAAQRTNQWSEPNLGGSNSPLNIPRALPSVTAGAVLKPAGTIINTEYITPNNNWASAEVLPAIGFASEHIQNTTGAFNFPTDGSTLHGLDLFNYLFADGHVELLKKQATVGNTNSALGTIGAGANRVAGMWSINPLD
jgi:prepilin-type processing-associated H-X9-DG protein